GELQERAIALVGLGHEVLRAPQARIGTHRIYAAANHDGRIQATSSEHGSNHGGSGRFAVHTRDGNPVLETHEFGEHLGPRNDRNMQPNGLEDFRIGRTNGGTYDNHIRPRDVLLTVPLKYSRAEPFQPVGDQGSLQVGTGDLVTKVE